MIRILSGRWIISGVSIDIIMNKSVLLLAEREMNV